MKKLVALVAAMGICMLFGFSTLRADENLEAYEGVKDLKIGGQWFLSYETGEIFNESKVNEFVIKRGYINIYKKLGNNLVGRITPDVSIDHEGDGFGDVELRLKYAHLITKIKDVGFLTKPYFEFGLVHRPWLEFEQQINQYRVQGTMFLERVKVFNSADFGITFTTLLGDELDKAYQKKVSKVHPGTYGSFSIGIYNGPGYHAIETNDNKPIETRLSLRPFFQRLPGLQVHYTGAYGKGNKTYSPDWTLNAGMISYEAARFVLMGQYFTGVGSSYGLYVDENQKSKSHQGYSFFGEYKIPSSPIHLFARYDHWDGNGIESVTDRAVAGVAYLFAEKSKVVLDYDYFHNTTSGIRESGILEMALEVKF